MARMEARAKEKENEKERMLPKDGKRLSVHTLRASDLSEAEAIHVCSGTRRR